jgi:succinate dehydrogenase hydrophobic anchor subunit|tara:strand:- start:583 stop:903 length:321 start_codon:yes stop_codon:yes gene_type:complete
MLRKIVGLVYALAILILIDLTATLFWVTNDLATEANPIMDFFLQVSPLLFVIAKLALSATGIWILYYFRKRFKRKIFKILLGLNLIYIAVFVYHLWGVLFLLFSTN